MDTEKTSKVAKCPQNNLNNYYCTWIKKKKKMFQQNCGRNITSCIHTPQCGVCIMCRALLWYDKKPAPDQISLSVRSQTGSSARKKTRRWREQMAFSCLTLSIWCFFFLHRGGVLPQCRCRGFKRGFQMEALALTWRRHDSVWILCVIPACPCLWAHYEITHQSPPNVWL